MNNCVTIVSEGPGITIGRRCVIGPGVHIYDSDFHPLAAAEREHRAPRRPLGSPTTSSSARCDRLKGVRVGVGDGRRRRGGRADVPAGTFVAGNPAREPRRSPPPPDRSADRPRPPREPDVHRGLAAIPFDIARVFYLYDVPGGESRAGHALKGVEQLLIAASGSFDVVLDYGGERETVALNRSYVGLYLPSLVWRELENFSSGAVCLVLASARYDEELLLPRLRQVPRDARPRARVRPSSQSPIRVLQRRARGAHSGIRGGARPRSLHTRGRGRAFERDWAASAARIAVGVSSGTDALALALRAAGVGPGDEVLVPAMTALATWMAVSQIGALPVGVDIEPAAERDGRGARAEAITPRTRALVAVHLFGQPADVVRLGEVAAERGPAAGRGCRASSRREGRRADGRLTRAAAAFSFYPTKNLGALGDAGAMTTSDAELAEQFRLLREYGWRTREAERRASTRGWTSCRRRCCA